MQEIEAAVVRHYTSRAGDPHRHLHLQINARVLAEDTWRGLHTVGVRDSLGAINGIGHAAVICDPEFRAALAGRGFTLEAASGEIVELAGFVGPFSARAAQIGRNVDRFEATWRLAHPGAEPGPRLRRSWDARAWAQDRPDKVVPKDGAELARAWVQELAGLGYHDPGPGRVSAAAGQPVRVGTLDRDGAARDVLVRLGARRSGWNAADVRGEVEQLIAAGGIIAGGPARLELAEDLRPRPGPRRPARGPGSRPVRHSPPTGRGHVRVEGRLDPRTHPGPGPRRRARRMRPAEQVVPLRAHHDAQVGAGRATYEQARSHATQAAEHADQIEAVVGADIVQLAGRLHQEWDTGRPAARAAAQTIAAGTGRIGQHRDAVRRASDHLRAWAQQWRPIVASLPNETDELAVLAAGYDNPSLGQALTAYARTLAEDAQPDHAPAQAAAHAADQTAQRALDAYEKARTSYPAELADHGNLAWLPDPADHLGRPSWTSPSSPTSYTPPKGGSVRRWPNLRPARCP